MRKSRKQLKARIRQLEAFITIDCDEVVPEREMTFADLPDYEDAKGAMERQVDQLVTRRLEDLVGEYLQEIDMKANRALNLAHRMDGHDTTCRRFDKEIKANAAEVKKLTGRVQKLEAKIKKTNGK